MTPIIRAVFVLLVAACLICLGVVVALFAQPTVVRAAPLTGSQCYTQDELEKDSLEAGGIIAGAAYYNGVNSDTVIMIQGKKEILAVLFKDGCFVGIEGVDLTAVGKGDPA